MDSRLQALRFTAARYIAGSLPTDEARAFEAEVRAQPVLVTELGLGAQLERAMRLLDADDVGRQPPWWRRPVAFHAALGLAGALFVALAFVIWRWDMAVDRQHFLEAKASEGFLAPTSGSATVKIDPELSKLYSIGGRRPERVELHITVRAPQFNQFRLQLARADGTFVVQVNRMARDSNGNLRLAVNTSLLPAATYVLGIEGLTGRGEAVPLRKVQLTVAR
jgi:hypothetical protein